MSGGDPIFDECYKSFPERPTIDVAETLYTREQLAARIDYWMQQLEAAAVWSQERQKAVTRSK